MGVEPTSSAWKAEIIAVIPQPQIQVERVSQPPARRQEFKERGRKSFLTFYKYYNKIFYKNQVIFFYTNDYNLSKLLLWWEKVRYGIFAKNATI